jgi:hypothetical protein
LLFEQIRGLDFQIHFYNAKQSDLFTYFYFFRSFKMANIYLDPTNPADANFLVTGNGSKVFGSNATNEVVTVASGVTGVTLNGNVEGQKLSGLSSDYTYKAAGTNLEVYKAGVLVSKIGVQGDADGTKVVFDNGSVSVTAAAPTVTNGVVIPQISIGGTLVTATNATDTATVTTPPVAVTPALINAGDASVTIPRFSVAASPAAVIEGESTTFTVTLANPPSTATSVNYTLTGLNATTTAADIGTLTGTNFTADATAKSGLASGVLNFAVGQTTATITVPTVSEVTAETGEGVTLTLSNQSTNTIITTTTATTTIADAPPPVFTLAAASATGGYEGKPHTFTVMADRAVLADTEISYKVIPGNATGTAQGTNLTNSDDFSQGSFNTAKFEGVCCLIFGFIVIY